MKPTVDEENRLLGDEAADYLINEWSGAIGMVDAEVIGPWLVIRRKGSDFSTFISLVDGAIATILHGDATTRHIPKHVRPDHDVPIDRMNTLGRVFEATSGGMYPLPDRVAFAIGFKDEDTYKRLVVGLTDDTFTVEEA